MRAFLRLLALYYALFDRRVIAASRQWWTAVDGEAPPWRKIYGHVRRFANVSVDRIFLLSDRAGAFTFSRDGDDHLARLERERRGAILLGAHLGSFEAMRLGGQHDELRLNIVGNFSNAAMANALLDRIGGGKNRARVIHADPSDIGFVFTIKERIEAGEMVAILGDRVAEGQASVTVDFFGRPARFPSGPFVLASLLKCPVYLTFGLFHEPNHYALSCEPFAERLDIPRKDREAALRAHVQRFAHRLEDKAREAPDNWFNFYDFWG